MTPFHSARIDRSGMQETPENRAEVNQARTSLYGVPDGTFKLPEIPLELIHYLNQQFPDQLKLVTALGSVDAAQGARTVVEHLIELHQEQQEIPHVLRRQVLDTTPGRGPSAAAARADGRPG